MFMDRVNNDNYIYCIICINIFVKKIIESKWGNVCV